MGGSLFSFFSFILIILIDWRCLAPVLLGGGQQHPSMENPTRGSGVVQSSLWGGVYPPPVLGESPGSPGGGQLGRGALRCPAAAGGDNGTGPQRAAVLGGIGA